MTLRESPLSIIFVLENVSRGKPPLTLSFLIRNVGTINAAKMFFEKLYHYNFNLEENIINYTV